MGARRHAVSAWVRRALPVSLMTSIALATAWPAGAVPSHGDTYLVSARGTDVSMRQLGEQVRAAGGAATEVLVNVRVVVAHLPPAAADQLSRRTDLLVERDATVVPDGTDAPTPSWGLDRVDQRALPLSTTYTWSSDESGVGVTAYVVDTGILSTHQEFTGRVAAGYNATPDGQGADDCLSQGHGTHVAGTVGGSTVGVARGVTLVPVRVFPCDGSAAAWSDVIRGVNWVIGHHPAGAPAVANLSLGGPELTTMDDVVQSLYLDGVLPVVSAGNNNGADACTFSPAGARDAVTVANANKLDARSPSSNVGPCVDVFAPGGDSNGGIYSSLVTSTSAYGYKTGTSMSAPHVTGLAARYLSRHPTATPAQVTQALLATATSGVLSDVGAGSPNRLAYLDPFGYATSPNPPTAVTAAWASAGVARVGWVAPVDSPGSYPVDTRSAPVTGYTLTARSGLGATVVTTPDAAATSAQVGLDPSQSWTFELRAVNRIGPSTAGTSPPLAAAVAAAGAPTGLKATYPATLMTTVSWAAPASFGTSPLLRYEIRWTTTSSTATFGAWTDAGTRTSSTITGIPRGATRYAQVRAVTAVGPGATSTTLTLKPKR